MPVFFAPPASYTAQQRFRHYLYLASIIIGVPKMLAVWYFIKEADAFARYAYPFLAFYCTWALIALLRARLSLETIERSTLAVLGLVWISRGVFVLFTSSTATLSEAVQAVYLSYILFTVLAYLMFDNTTALKLSLGIFAISLTLSTLRVGLGRFDAGYLETFQFQAYLAVIIGSIHALSHVKTELSESRARAEMLEQIAYKDSLTGLNNRHRVYEALKNNVLIAERYTRPLSIILFDIDHFKQINDTFGHDIGDKVLKDFASLLTPLLRKTDLLGRWGGEEFIVICHETPLDDAKRLAERLCTSIAQHDFPKVKNVTASFGAVSHSSGLSTEALLKAADILLYQAKQSGRNQVRSQEAHPLLALA